MSALILKYVADVEPIDVASAGDSGSNSFEWYKGVYYSHLIGLTTTIILLQLGIISGGLLCQGHCPDQDSIYSRALLYSSAVV
jgi:hypothetical protein